MIANSSVSVEDFLAASNVKTASDAWADSKITESTRAVLKALLFATAGTLKNRRLLCEATAPLNGIDVCLEKRSEDCFCSPFARPLVPF